MKANISFKYYAGMYPKKYMENVKKNKIDQKKNKKILCTVGKFIIFNWYLSSRALLSCYGQCIKICKVRGSNPDHHKKWHFTYMHTHRVI